MNILADTNIFIDFWRNPDQETMDVFSDGRIDIHICEQVYAELPDPIRISLPLLMR